MRPGQKVETFPDGIVEVYKDAPGRKIGEKVATLHFEEMSVGVNRFYQAQAAVSTNRIDRVIKVPHTDLVNRMDIAIVKSKSDLQYRIFRIQEKPERGVDLWELQSVAVSIRRDEG